MRGAAAWAGLALLVLTACTDDPTSPAQTVEAPFLPCPAATAEPTPPIDLPITLPCFAGGSEVALARIGRPAVINLWASWCEPCRIELPDMQRLADLAEAKHTDLVVLGVVTEDRPVGAASLADELGITFPSVLDPSAEVRRSTGRQVLPMTLFVDANGHVQYTHTTGTLTRDAAAALAQEHLGVVLE